MNLVKIMFNKKMPTLKVSTRTLFAFIWAWKTTSRGSSFSWLVVGKAVPANLRGSN